MALEKSWTHRVLSSEESFKIIQAYFYILCPLLKEFFYGYFKGKTLDFYITLNEVF